MDISLQVLPDSFHVNEQIDCCGGRITIEDDFESDFRMALNLWSALDYERQWQEGLKRIKTHDSSCLVTCVHNPTTSDPYISWWTLHKEGDAVHVQNELIFGDDYLPRIGQNFFSPETCYNFIGERNPKKQLGWVGITTFVLDV